MTRTEKRSVDESDEPNQPTKRGRLGFSRGTISLIGFLLALAFLIWVFLPF